MVRIRIAPVILAFLAASSPLLAASRADLEQRVDQLERKLDSQGLIDMQDQLDRLRQDLQQLRGDMEVQMHRIEQLDKKQRDLYLDMDRRLGAVEARQPGGVAPETGVEPGASGAVYGTGAGAAADEPVDVPAPSDSPEARQAYDSALNLLKQKRYTEASRAFTGFLKDHPNSSYADNAQYWIGEAHYVTREFKPALSEFQKVVTQYPNSAKVPDARLKIGFINYELQQWGEARTTLGRVVADFPGTRAAQLADERLARMKQEGH